MSEAAKINIRNDRECRKLESLYHHLENANELFFFFLNLAMLGAQDL